MRILLFGGFGLLGYDLNKAFISSGFEVYRFNSRELDLLNTDSVERYLDSLKPDYIVNAAGYTNVGEAELNFDAAFQGNVLTIHSLIKCIKNRDIPLVHFSTDYIFNGKKEMPYSEADFADPINKYGWSKYTSENLIISNLSKYYIVRTSGLFGSHGKCFPYTILQKLIEGNELRVVSNQVASPTYTVDLSQAVVSLLKAPYGIYHYSNEGAVSWYDYAVAIAELSGKNKLTSKIIPVEEGFDHVMRPQFSVLNTDKIQNVLSISIRNYKQALQEYLQFIK